MNIAVIIPVGPSHGTHAAVAVRSVLAQSIAARPIVINDSGRALVPWIQTIDTNGGHGVAAARNIGVKTAVDLGADFVVFLDADDILMPRAIEAMIRTYALGQGSYVYGDSISIMADPVKSGYQRTPEYDPMLYRAMNIHTVSALVPAALAAQVPWIEGPWEDYVYWAKFAARGWCGMRTPYPVIAYRMELGQRRNAGFAAGAAVADELRQRFISLVDGGKIMGCCNGDRRLGGIAQQAVSALSGAPRPAGTVRLGFSGNNAGPIPYRANGRVYYGSRDAEVYAHPEDLPRLKSFGVWYEMPDLPTEADQAAIQAASQGMSMDSSQAIGIANALAEVANQSVAEVDALAAGMAAAAQPKKRRRRAAPPTSEATE